MAHLKTDLNHKPCGSHTLYGFNMKASEVLLIRSKYSEEKGNENQMHGVESLTS
jgi:hypothetical protein